ncbi:MAG: PH domain-containing protein [Chitinophagaceae bacterium]
MEKELNVSNFENLQLNFNQIPQIQKVTLSPIQSSYKKVIIYTWIIVYIILFVLMGLGYFFIDEFKQNHPLIITVLSSYIALLTFTFLYINIEFKNRSFALRQHDVVYKSGWIFQTIEALPFSKIQHCTVSQNVIAKKFNLANITFYTAASHGGDVTIHGLTFEQAEQLKDFIMQQTKAKHDQSQD